MSQSQGGEAWVEVGRVLRPHGFDGVLLVELHGDDPGNLLGADIVTLTGDPGAIPFQVKEARAAGPPRDGHGRVRLVLSGLDSRERAQVWSGARLSIPEHALQPLPEGEFYWRELMGLRCRLPDGRELGVVEEIRPGGLHDVLVIRDGTHTHLVPTPRGVLVRLDRAEGQLWIAPPDGWLEEE